MRPAFDGQRRRPHSFFWIVLLVGVILLGHYAFTVHVLRRHGGLQKDRGWTFNRGPDGRPFIARVDPQGPAAGKLFAGDRILAINGDDRVSLFVSAHFLDLRPGDSYMRWPIRPLTSSRRASLELAPGRF